MLPLTEAEIREVKEMSVKLGLREKATMRLAMSKGADILIRAIEGKDGQG